LPSPLSLSRSGEGARRADEGTFIERLLYNEVHFIGLE